MQRSGGNPRHDRDVVCVIEWNSRNGCEFPSASSPMMAALRTTRSRRETNFDTRIPIITNTKLYHFCSLLRSPTSRAAARKPHLTHGFHFHVADFTFTWRTQLPSAFVCGDQSHIPAKTRNVLILFQKRLRALLRPQKRNGRDRSR